MATTTEIGPLLREELRSGWLEMPERYQLLDFLGVALGSYFIYAGATDRAPRWLTIALGGVMVYIHSQRFFYAPRTRGGLFRLLQALEIDPAELC